MLTVKQNVLLMLGTQGPMCRESVKMTASVAGRYVVVIVFPRPLASYPVKVGRAVSGLQSSLKYKQLVPYQRFLRKQHFLLQMIQKICNYLLHTHVIANLLSWYFYIYLYISLLGTLIGMFSSASASGKTETNTKCNRLFAEEK